MEVSTLLADPTAIRLTHIVSADKSLTLVVSAGRLSAGCPKCGCTSVRVHSHYTRRVADLPWHGVAVRLELHTRRFFCVSELCQRRIFCERLPSVVAASARKTARLISAIELIGFALGGEAGARLARELGLSVSPDTLLERIRRAALPEASTPRVLGVDDWAKRKGSTYGTILIDHERHRPVDLLLDREAGTLAAWLHEHPGVEVITRDRGGAYADGARQGAPDAIQVADRWHLLKNISEVFERLLNRHRKVLRQAASNVDVVPGQVVVASSTGDLAKVNDAAVIGQQIAVVLEAKEQNVDDQQHDAENKALYVTTQELKRQGLTINQIRLQVGRHHSTIGRLFGADLYPERAPRRRPRKQASPFDTYLRQRWAEGCHNAKHLFDEIKAQGYGGSSVTIRRYVRGWREPVPMIFKTPLAKAPSPRSVVWLFLKPTPRLTDDEQKLIASITTLSPTIKRGCELVQEFRRIVRERVAESLTSWMDSAAQSGLVEFENFVTNLHRDEAAVRAGLTHAWSNGQTEGQVNRLKYIKRQMFGRAKFDLLRARVLHAN